MRGAGQMSADILVTKEKCCGCKLCAQVCPKNAITYQTDTLGAYYPSIDESKCIGCKKCANICPAEKNMKNAESVCFAAVNRDEAMLTRSASGGVFSALASAVLKDGGVVYGAAAMHDEKLLLRVAHKRITSCSELSDLQRSKYVQSDMEGIYSLIRKDLKDGKTVFFSGTPCQVAAVKALCGEPENLLLGDIICHGVPSQKLFSEYLQTLSHERSRKIENFYFRTKESGWGLCARVITSDRRGKIRSRRIPCNISSYYKMFLRCETYRDACYSCPYATRERVGDLTMGDFWGLEKAASTYAECKENRVELTSGVSCVLANTPKGLAYMQKADLLLMKAEFDDIARENGQLLHPSPLPKSREGIIDLYLQAGYGGLERQFNRALGAKKYMILLRNRVSPKIRMKVKTILRK